MSYIFIYSLWLKEQQEREWQREADFKPGRKREGGIIIIKNVLITCINSPLQPVTSIRSHLWQGCSTRPM